MMFDPTNFHLVKTVNKRAFETGYPDNPISAQDYNDWRALGNTVGVMCGVKGNIYVIDVDDIDKATETLLRWQLPATLLVKTPSGGYHYYFRYDGEALPRRIRPFPGIDLLGKGGYANCHLGPKGDYSHYTIEHIAELPENVLEDWRSASEPDERAKAHTNQQGGRNETLTSFCGAWFKQGMTYVQVMQEAQRWGANCVPPMPINEIASVVQSVSRYHQQKEDEPEIKAEDLGGLIMSASETMALELTPIEQICGALYSACVLMIAGVAGVGKSLHTLAMAAHIAAGRDFSTWHTPKARRVLYVDGEMAPQYMQARLDGLPESDNLGLIHLESMRRHEAYINFGKEAWRNYFLQPEIFDAYDVFIFDTVSSLVLSDDAEGVFAPGYWLQLESFHQQFRAHGKTVIWVDNLNKSGEIYGTAVKHHKVDAVWRYEVWKGQPKDARAAFTMFQNKQRGDGIEADGKWYKSAVYGWQKQ